MRVAIERNCALEVQQDKQRRDVCVYLINLMVLCSDLCME